MYVPLKSLVGSSVFSFLWSLVRSKYVHLRRAWFAYVSLIQKNPFVLPTKVISFTLCSDNFSIKILVSVISIHGARLYMFKAKITFKMVRTKAPFRLGARARARCSGTKMDVVQTRQCPDQKVFITIKKSATNLYLVLQQVVRR